MRAIVEQSLLRKFDWQLCASNTPRTAIVVECVLLCFLFIKEKYMKIRNISLDDYEEIYRLWLSTPGMGLNDTDDYLKRNPNTCFVAETRGRIIGVILSGHDGRRGYIHHAAVSMENRNKGIGSALVDSALEALRDEGISKVALVIFENNEIGNTFWENKGFSVREDLVYRNKALTEMKRIDM
jgi:ribosomal protein S18 acetylase RimI-like enzyme